MHKQFTIRAAFLTALLLIPIFVGAKTREEVPEKYRWNLADLYPTKEALKSDLDSIDAKAANLQKCKSHLGDSSKQLKQCLDEYFEAAQQLAKLSTFATINYDENLKNSEAQKTRDQVYQLGVKFSESTAWFTPEILTIGKEKIDAFASRESGLSVYKHFLDDTLRTAAHTLSPAEEAILSRTGMISDAAYNTYSVYTSADMKFPKVTLSDGTAVQLDQASYTKYRAVPNPADRKLVFDSFFGAFTANENTLGVLLNAQNNRDWFYAKSRKYDSSVEAALDAGNIPLKVYTELIADINKNLPSLHRYLALRKRMLGLDTLQYSDTYTPIVKNVDISYSYEDAVKLMEESLRPLGEEYEKAVADAVANRWLDVYPNEGKRNGAYSIGNMYTGHPYMLLNYNNDYESLSTLTHEMGHTLHSYFSSRYQPVSTSDYETFVAEVASTFNETLLNNDLVEKEKDPAKKLFLLGNQLERARTTIFRQAMFAEFELETHKRVEQREPLTGKELTELYLKLVRKYYGQDKGVCQVSDAYGVEWAYIPHFYYNFYVFQYATGQVASTALAEKVMTGDKAAIERYLNFLKAGNSDYPIEVLKTAGVDLTTSEPFELAMRSFNRTMDQIEQILTQMNK